MQIQTIDYDFKDKIRTKKEVILIPYSFTPSDMNFKTILISRGIFAKILSEKADPLKLLSQYVLTKHIIFSGGEL